MHRVYLRMPGAQRLITRESFPYARYLDLKNWNDVVLAGRGVLPGQRSPSEVATSSRERPIAAVSASYFDFFDARPALGRYFVAAEDTTPSGGDRWPC